MHVTVTPDTITLLTPEGVLQTLPRDPLTEAEMLLQARYHLWLRKHEYRRTLVCRRCRQEMTSDTQMNEDNQTWAMLSHCQCRAIYGTIAWRTIRSRMMTSTS